MVAKLWHYGCFSTGMRDDHKIMLIDWQEAPLGYSASCSILPTAANNHAGKHLSTWKSLKPVKSLLQQAKLSVANQ